jgi:predicted TIM-barrel fold metal-dependent hydrolase
LSDLVTGGGIIVDGSAASRYVGDVARQEPVDRRAASSGVDKMHYPFVSLENPHAVGQPAALWRKPQAKTDVKLPEGLRIISADGHWEIGEDIFYDAFPEPLRHKAPRVWFDQYWRCGNPNAPPMDPELEQRVDHLLRVSLGEGGWDIHRRERDLTIEGVEKEIVYPQNLLAFTRHPDREVQEQIYLIYNEYIAKLGAAYPGRFYGVGVCSNWWDPRKAYGAIRQIVDLGLCSFMLPTQNPGLTPDGRPIHYGGTEMEAFWSEVADAGLPVAFHVGENISMSGRGSIGSTVFTNLSPFRRPFGELVFGGVFDRHPELNIVFAEGGLGWVPSALEDAEMIFDLHWEILDYRPQRRPSDYWRECCYATFQNDRVGLKLIEHVGVERAMWASDYPHSEGGWGFGWDSLGAVFEAVGDAAGRRIVGQNAIELYGLDRCSASQSHAGRHVKSV